MSRLAASAASIGVLSAALVWLYVGPLASLGLQTWAGFIAWGAYAHAGGGWRVAGINLSGHLLGAILSVAAHMPITLLADLTGVPAAAGLLVGLGSAAFVLASRSPLFATIPAAVYGFSCAAVLINVAKLPASLTALPPAQNPLFVVALSMTIGIGFGLVCDWLTERLQGRSKAAAA
ncbi:MAG: DUF1097 domain-containing protein [Rhizobiaceae bacterium]